MPRLLFEKTGKAVWISHLDLMRLFQRAFKRAGLALTHTQGFNPRPSVSIALPLSVGVESQCELLDFELDGNSIPLDEIAERLNNALIPGVRVLSVYNSGRKLKELALLECTVALEYDNGVPQDAAQEIGKLFSQESIIVAKKTKNGMQEQDIRPMIREFEIEQKGDIVLQLRAMICAQNPTLNPAQLTAAIQLYKSGYYPDYTWCKRIEIYDSQGEVFR